MLTHAATWKNLGDVTPREISQVQKVLIDSRHLRCPEQADPQRQKGEKNIEKNIRDIQDLEKIFNICGTELSKGVERK